MNTYKKLSLSILTLCISQQLYAETTNEVDTVPSATLDTITITAQAKTGTALGQKISEMPVVTQVIYEDEIAEQVTGSRTIGDILAQLVPSLGLSSGSTSNYATTMRGRPVQYLLNGVPLTGSRNLSRQLNSIDSTQLERIEVLSGATSIYGAGATGGLINLVTKSGGNQYGLHGETRVGVNSNRTFEGESLGYNIGQSIDYANDSIYGRLDVDYETKGGSFDSHAQRISPDVNQTDQQDTKTLSINANLNWDLTDTQSINLAATHYNNEQDSDYGPDYAPSVQDIANGTSQPSLKGAKGLNFAHQPYTTKNSVNLTYHNDDFLGSSLNISGYYRDEQGRFYTKPIKPLITYNVLLQSEADIKVKGVRAAMQTATQFANRDVLVSYGADYEQEHDEQYYYGHDAAKFKASNGLTVERNGKRYFGGPEADITKTGVFANLDIDFTNKLHASAGVRHQIIEAETQAFITRNTQIYHDLAGLPLTEVPAGKAENNKTLFNLGASYQLNANNQVFANFSQGFTFADVQRALRSADADFKVNSNTVKPVSVDSYELGWKGDFDNTNVRISGFYNTSDKSIKFDKHEVKILDADEKVYGAEASINHDFSNQWTLGSSLAYTRGQYKVENGDWKELDATRITPLKGTAFAQYNFDGGSNIRLQALAVGGTDKAYKENGKSQPVIGYATLDLLGQVELPAGYINYGIYNLLNKEYQSVYHQTTYGALNRLDAQGTTYGLSYTIEY